MAESGLKCPKCGHRNQPFGNSHADQTVTKYAINHRHSFIAGAASALYAAARFGLIPITCANCHHSYRNEKE